MTNYNLEKRKRDRDFQKWQYSDEDLGYIFEEIERQLSAHGINDMKHAATVKAILLLFRNWDYGCLSIVPVHSRLPWFSTKTYALDDMQFVATRTRLIIKVNLNTEIRLAWKSIERVTYDKIETKAAGVAINYYFSRET